MSLRHIARRVLERLADPPQDRPGQERRSSGAITRRLEVSGRRRWYDLFVPPNLNPAKEAPLILGFHGRSSAPAQFAYLSQLNRRGGNMGYVIAYPAAEDGVWNCAPSESNNINYDVAFVMAMLEDIRKIVPVDANRTFGTGMSNGGQMVYRLACELSDRLAAIAVCACGMKREPCQPRRGVPVLHFHGTQDGLVPLAWGQDAVNRWIEFDHCEGVPAETFKNGAATCLTYSNPSARISVTLCTIDGMGHQWPGLAIRLSEGETKLLGLPPILSRLGPGTDDLDATGMMLTFFTNMGGGIAG
jgi:polyhydroxybutyrate depolymerase